MGLFGSIFESVINEIKAEDAYNRYYNSIPREVFDQITGGEQNIDKFLQFFLNCVRDGKSTAEEALAALEAYKGADQLVKQKIKNKISAGEYEDALDVSSDIKYFSNGGGVLSRKKFAKEGYIKLGENDRWLCTCTTNYCANNHYYGDSHWCTASDRLGRYDGYHYFKSYTFNCSENCALIQYKWKGAVTDDENAQVTEDQFDGDNGFVGDVIPRRYYEFQVQVDEYGNVQQLCDFLDNSQYTNTLRAYVGVEMCSILTDDEKLKFCINKTLSQNAIEEPYQTAIWESLRKKKEKRDRELAAKRERLAAECEQLNNEKKEMIKQKWAEVTERLANGDLELLNVLWERDINRNGYDIEEETLSKTYYARMYRRREITRNINFVQIIPTWGNLKTVEVDYLSNGLEDAFIRDELRTSKPFNAGMALVVNINDRETRIENVINKFGPFDETIYIFGEELAINSMEARDRFFEVSTENYSARLMYDARRNTSFDIKFDSHVLYTGNHKFIFVDDNDDNRFRDYLIYDEESGQATTPEEGYKCYKVWYNSAYSFIKEGEDYQTVFAPNYGLNGCKVPSTNIIEEVSDCTEEGDGKFIYMSFDLDNSGPSVNMYSTEEQDFVFGINGGDTWCDGGNCILRYVVKSKVKTAEGRNQRTRMRLIRKQDGSYVKEEDGKPSTAIPCDKNGVTDKEKLGDYNMKKYWKGYSPETQAQMDAMWADRQAKETDGSEAMKDWNDMDTRRDLGQPGTSSHALPRDTRFLSPQMKAALKDPRWKGTIGIKDPEGFMKSVPSDNPFYRIGGDGKPIDQPWNDEDEVPARFSDDSLNEAVNKIKSLFDRMGLLED